LRAACVACATSLAIGCSATSPTGNPAAPPDAAEPDTQDAVAAESASEDTGSDAALATDDASGPADASDAVVIVPAAFVEENAPLRILQAGDSIDLVRAPQGGHVVMLAAQVRNMTSSAATLRVRMRRRDTGFIVAEEKRTVAMVPVPGEPDAMQPDLRSRSQMAHVPLCPDYDPIDVVGQLLDVDIEVTALYTDPPRIGSTRIPLVPSCRQTTPEEQALCRCECEANYALGKCWRDARAP
jgi:hypothetical protein